MTDALFLMPIEKLISMFKKDRKTRKELALLLLERIQKYDKELRSFTALNYGITEEIDKASMKSELAGLPVAIKDLIDTSGLVTTYGSKAYRTNTPDHDAELIRSLKRNGGTILGKTNTHEFALGISTPPTRNPWDTSRIPGGSSGGSAASVAAGLSVFAIGTDTGGSIRIPSSMCGITGLKPTYGKISMGGTFPESFSEDHAGPMSRYASDLNIGLRSLGYSDLRPSMKNKYKVGIIENFFEQSNPGVGTLVNEAIDLLVSERVIVETKRFEIPNLHDIWKNHEIIDKAETHYVHSDLKRVKKIDYSKDAKDEIDAGRHISASKYISALQFKPKGIQDFSLAIQGLDAIISPTLPVTAPTLKEVEKFNLSDHEVYTKFLTPFNYLGVPAITVPCGFNGGLPVGMQLISDVGNDCTVISLASAFQKLTDWHKRRPPNFK